MEENSNADVGLRISLFGAFRVWVHGEEIPANAWRLQKARAVVKLLALTPGHRLHRAEITEYLWPDFDPLAGTNNLHRTLHAARRALSTSGKPGLPSPTLRLQGQLICLDPAGDLWIDTEAFMAASAAARARGDPDHYEQALAICSGELLPGDRYEEWTRQPREQIERERLTLMQELADLCRSQSELARAIELRREIVQIDPFDEDARLELMRDLARSGQRSKALAQFEQLRHVLSEMGTVPAKESEQLYRAILSRSFPPAERDPSDRAEGGSKTNLPVSVTRFIGRDHERVELAALLDPDRDAPRLLTLTGPGGSGKTRLALTVSRDVADRFPGGVWFVDLASLHDGDELPNAIASALGVDEIPGCSITEAMVDVLGKETALLVWDNCEHVPGACARLARLLLLRVPSVRILVTSRQALGIHGEAIWRVAPLPLPPTFPAGTPLDEVMPELQNNPCIVLFSERARLVRSDFRVTAENAPVIIQICRRLDGMPLALELAAARMGSMSAIALARRLDRALQVLGSGARGTEPRQRTLRGTLDWSYEHLSPPERALFRRLSVFTSGWTLEMAEQVCSGEDLPVLDVLGLLADLIDKSLVQFDASPTGGRYRFLEVVRQYAEEQLATSGEEPLFRRRHAEQCIVLAETTEPLLRGPEQASCLERLEHEYGNIRSAIQWLQRSGNLHQAIRLTSAIWWFCFLRGHYSEARERLSELLQEADESQVDLQRTVRAKALLAAGALAWKREELPLARKLLEESLAIRRVLDDPADTAWSLSFLGHVAGSQGDFELGRICAAEALDLFRRAGDRAGMARALNALGEEARRRGQDAQAEAYYQEGLQIDRQLGNRSGMALRLHNLGYVALHRNRVPEAAKSFLESLHLAQELKDLDMVAACFEGIAAVASVAGEAPLGMRLFAAAERLRAELNVPIDIADQPEHDRFFAVARASLSSSRIQAEWTGGTRMSLDDSIGAAMSFALCLAGPVDVEMLSVLRDANV